MSGFKAIAGVTSSLRTLLRDRMEQTVPVTIVPPDVKPSGSSGKRVNLYLYQVNENGYLKNQEVPGRAPPPPLSLNLHYLVTAYPANEEAETSDLEAQQVLGDAMRVLHDFGILTEDLEITSASGGTVGTPVLDVSLQGEFERIKIVLEPSSLEEHSKIWTALPEANFRRSVTYEVSVVQIESGHAPRVPLPVSTRRVRVGVLQPPTVSAVYRTPSAAGDPARDGRAAVGQSLTIEGSGFTAPRTWVRLGDLSPVEVSPASDSRIELTIPDEEALQPGPQPVQVRIERTADVVEGGLDRGTSAEEADIQASNEELFLLVPRISSTSPAGGAASGLLTVTGSRLYRKERRSYVVVGDVAIQVREKGAADPWDPPTDTRVQVPLTDLASLDHGTYAVRVMANGTLSAETDKTYGLTP